MNEKTLGSIAAIAIAALILAVYVASRVASPSPHVDAPAQVLNSS